MDKDEDEDSAGHWWTRAAGRGPMSWRKRVAGQPAAGAPLCALPHQGGAPKEPLGLLGRETRDEELDNKRHSGLFDGAEEKSWRKRQKTSSLETGTSGGRDLDKRGSRETASGGAESGERTSLPFDCGKQTDFLELHDEQAEIGNNHWQPMGQIIIVADLVPGGESNFSSKRMAAANGRLLDEEQSAIIATTTRPKGDRKWWAQKWSLKCFHDGKLMRVKHDDDDEDEDDDHPHRRHFWFASQENNQTKTTVSKSNGSTEVAAAKDKRAESNSNNNYASMLEENPKRAGFVTLIIYYYLFLLLLALSAPFSNGKLTKNGPHLVVLVSGEPFERANASNGFYYHLDEQAKQKQFNNAKQERKKHKEAPYKEAESESGNKNIYRKSLNHEAPGRPRASFEFIDVDLAAAAADPYHDHRWAAFAARPPPQGWQVDGGKRQLADKAHTVHKRSEQSSGPTNEKERQHNDGAGQLQSSHHIVCEPISQLNDLRLSCPKERQQFIVILEAYYTDSYPEHVCPKVYQSDEFKFLQHLTAKKLVRIFQQLYTTTTTTNPTRKSSSTQTSNKPNNIDNYQDDQNDLDREKAGHQLIRLAPTIQSELQNGKQPFCVDDLRQSFQAKCSGRDKCKFSKNTDHQFPRCVSLKPGHVFVRYLCVDNRLLLKYCNANTLLASKSSLLNGASKVIQDRTFGFVASPGYPNFYATPKGRFDKCGWTIEAEPGRKITVKLLDTSLAPRKTGPQAGASALNPLLQLLGHDASMLEYPDYSVPNLEAPPNLLDQPQTAESISKFTENGSKPEEVLLISPVSINNQQADSKESGANIQIVSDQIRSGDKRNGNYETRRKVVFKINQHDYELIRLKLSQIMKQNAEQCRDFDHLSLINYDKLTNQIDDSPATRSGNNQTSVLVERQKQQQEAEKEFDMISKLPIRLYKNNLIDFNNKTLFKQMQSSTDEDQQQVDEHGNRTINLSIDYQLLLDSMNPIQVIWLYQQNVSICSSSQVFQQEFAGQNQEGENIKQSISFTSSANRIHLDLISGRTFNPLNRGILFWFHKHGCPMTRKPPKRSRLLFRNETTEIFECFDNFVFSDTRQKVRIRHCSLEEQNWFDEEETSNRNGSKTSAQSPGVLPGCVFIEDLLTQSQAAKEQRASKFDRLVLSSDSSLAKYQPASWSDGESHLIAAHTGQQEELAVEIVGLPQQSNGFQSDGRNFNELLVSDVDLIQHQHQQQHNQQHKQASDAASRESIGGDSNKLVNIWYELVDFIIPKWDPGRHNARLVKSGHSNDDENVVHKQQQQSMVAPWSVQRLLIPAFAVITMFVLLNLLIYLVFLVLLPKFARLLWSNKRNSERATFRASQANGTNRLLLSRENESPKSSYYEGRKLGHHEAEYSVSLGMSL